MVIRLSGGITTSARRFADGLAKKAPICSSCAGPALTIAASTSTARAGELPELNSSISNSILTC